MNDCGDKLADHHKALKECALCPQMIGPVVTGQPVRSRILLIGQAPGAKEGDLGRPFAWTAGKTLFKWFAEAGLDESRFRNRVYMAAVCRCFPGKNPKGGDRVPSISEIQNCSRWLDAELELLEPGLIIPVGKLAISQLISFDKLKDVVGRQHTLEKGGTEFSVIPLPHPSGASTWHRTEPGKSLLNQALRCIGDHPAWTSVCDA